MNTIDTIKKNFIKRGFHFDYFEDCSDAIDYVLSLIPEGSSVGFGGSVSVTESGLLDAMMKKNYDLIHRAIRTDIPYDEIYTRMFLCDWYVSSANAITQTGEIVNIDGRGNRVAAIIDGPKKVVIFCGVNKIVEDVAEGIERTRNVASPKNCVRLNRKTPCAVTGKCENCNSPDTICKATVILHHPTTGTEMYVVLINKELGY